MKRPALVCAALAALAAAPAAAQQCVLAYQRADNMWAASGRPDGALGTETLTLQPGETKVFITDWKYEKQRNDGRNYYGSHTRIVRNTGKREMNLQFRGDDIRELVNAMRGALGVGVRQVASDRATGTLRPGGTWRVKADLMEASCPPAEKVEAPSGLAAQQVSPREIVLTWQKAPGAHEYRVYVAPPPAPHLANRPIVVSGSGTRIVVPLPASVAPGTVYRASIEAVGPGGGTSPRAEFNPVTVQLASGGTPSGGTPGGVPGGTGNAPATSPSTTPSFAGQRCPAGQFVTGFDNAGKIVCASPPAPGPSSSSSSSSG